MKSICLAILVLLCATAAFAQPARPPSDWAAIQALKPGRDIRVETDFERTDCKFLKADADSITCHQDAQGGILLRTPASDLRFRRDEVLRIRPVGKRLARSFALGGAIAGLVVGAFSGGLFVLPAALLFGAIGYIVGDIVDWPRQAWPRDPLYEAP